ncbi:hypothetical protein E4V51_15065, partial [Paenibacillus sp. 28ISP30-2]|nr:hypothetical protein [Paenibacillus sp. 28ISP30-2]
GWSSDGGPSAYILAEACPPKGLGDAVMNRLLKAAGHRVVRL